MTRADTLATSIDRAHAKAAAEARQAEMRATADRCISAALDACDARVRPYLSVALLNRSAEAVAKHHDGPRAQAALGQAAARHGAQLPNPPGVNPARARAEKLFRRKG